MTQSALARASPVERPTREAVIQRAPCAHQVRMRTTDHFQFVWQDPITETAIRDLRQVTLAGTCKTRFLDPERLSLPRDDMDKVADAASPRDPHRNRPTRSLQASRHPAGRLRALLTPPVRPAASTLRANRPVHKTNQPQID